MFLDWFDCRLFNAKSCSYLYIKYMICKHILSITWLNELELFCTQLFQIFITRIILFTADSEKGRGYKYFYLTLIIPFNITHSFALLNGSKYNYVSLKIQLNINHLFVHS